MTYGGTCQEPAIALLTHLSARREERSLEWGFLVSNSGFFHPDVLGKGHRARPRLLCPGLTCEWIREDECLSIRVNTKVKPGFASSSRRLPLLHLRLSNAKNSWWLLSQDVGVDAHRSSQIRPTTELCLSKTALKYCFHHTASRGYGHKAKKKRFSDIHQQNIEENCSKTCLLLCWRDS